MFLIPLLLNQVINDGSINLSKYKCCKVMETSASRLKEARGSFFGRGMEVLKLQSRIEDQLQSPSYYIMIST